MGKQGTVINMHIVDLNPLLTVATTLEEVLQHTEELWSAIYDEMSPDESLWVFVPNRYSDGEFWPAAMAVADDVRTETSFVLKNIITRYRNPAGGGDMKNVYEEILFLVKDKRAYRFNKDEIRVAHVYEGNEWGGERTKGSSAYHDAEVQRYNPNGKDPGNVWLEEIRDQSSGETVDETKPLPRNEALKRCIRAGSNEGESVHLWLCDDSFEETVVNENREPMVRSIERSSVQ